MTTATRFMVGMADIHVAKGDAHYTCLGLGSCIGIVLFDSRANISGMIHLMLPEAFPDRPVDKIGKFADTGIPHLYEQVLALGASKQRLVAAYAGGAQVFQGGGASGGRLDVGARNGVATETVLKNLGLRVVAQDIGGKTGRTVIFSTESGVVSVRTVLAGEKPLCNLKVA